MIIADPPKPLPHRKSTVAELFVRPQETSSSRGLDGKKMVLSGEELSERNTSRCDNGSQSISFPRTNQVRSLRL
jgi:hypothetical protein